MKVAITGENGFLGYHLTQYYKNKGWEVVSLGRNYLENLQLIEGVEFLIHAAGVNRASSDQEVYRANVELASDLVNRLTQLNLKTNIKFISSVQETNGSMYGEAKLKAKELLQNYCDELNTNFESYALPNLFGTHGKPNYNSFVNTFAYNILNRLDCNYNDNKIKLCWVYDAIEVVDNQTKEYRLFETTVNEVYFLLYGINNGSIEVMMSLLAVRLEQILNYYKNENINTRS